MRGKIIIVNSTIVVIVGLLSFALLKAGLSDVLSNSAQRRSEASRAVRSASMLLELDSLRLERWLAAQATAEEVTEVFAGGTSQARSESASVQAKRLRDAAVKSASLTDLSIPLVVFADARGVAIGRNDSSQMRGEDLGRSYPSIARTLASGQTSSHVWHNRSRSEQLLVSYAPVRSESGAVVGLLIAGTPLDDERLSQVSQQTSGHALTVAVAGEGDDTPVEIIAEGARSGDRSVFQAMRDQRVLSRAAAALRTGRGIFNDKAAVYGAEALRSYGADTRVIIVAGVSHSLVASVAGLLWPLFAVSVLGILMVIGAGVFLGNYMSRPISELEDGLLAVINGRTNHRFELEHPELGGLVFRINSLLNALMGVPETDAEGRTSVPPGAPYRESERA